jgi:hypothetical protein
MNHRNDEEHLLASATNAARLRAAIESAREGKGTPFDLDRAREEFLADYAKGYEQLRESNHEEWAEVQAERPAFDGSLMDGFQDGLPYSVSLNELRQMSPRERRRALNVLAGVPPDYHPKYRNMPLRYKHRFDHP